MKTKAQLRAELWKLEYALSQYRAGAKALSPDEVNYVNASIETIRWALGEIVNAPSVNV